jgi:hypothetical protein
MNYYTDFTSRLPKIQKDYIEKYIADRSAEGLLTQEQIDTIRTSAWGQSDTIKPISPSYIKTAIYGGSMSEVEYDSLMDAVMIDLNTIFAYSSVIDNNLSGIEDNMKNFVKSVNVTIDSVERSLAEYRALLGDVEGYNAAHTQTFNNITGARLINTDVKGGYLSLSPKSIKCYNNSSDIASVSVNKYPLESNLLTGGVYYASPPQNNIEKDYNEPNGTRLMLRGGTTGPGYWVEIMLVDNTSDNEVSSYVDNKLYQGLTLVLTIYFTGTISINEINLDPISKYLVYLRQIRYLPTGSGAWTPILYTGKDGNKLNLTGEGEGSLSFKFDRVSVYGLELTLNVVDYDIVRFLIDPKTIFLSEVWNEILDGKYSAMSEKASSKDVISSSKKEDSNTLYNKVKIASSNDYSIYRSEFGEDETIAGKDITKAAIADKMALAEVNMKEYILGLYSLSPSNATYYPSGVYYSHLDGGYDTKKGTIRSVILEDDHSTPAATTIEYYIVTDSGKVIPILPIGTTTYREPVLSKVVGSNVTVTLTYEPSGNVYLKYWDQVSNSMVDVSNGAATNKVVTLSGAVANRSYIVEYTLATTIDQITVSIPAQISASGWFHGDIYPQGYKAPLPVTPYIDMSYYDSGTDEWLGRHQTTLSAYGPNGFYSDPTVLTQDISDVGYWTIIPAVTGCPALLNAAFLYATNNSYVISGYINPGDIGSYGAWYRVIFTGTGRENNEYSYVWDVSGALLPIGSAISGLTLTSNGIYNSVNGREGLYYTGDTGNQYLRGVGQVMTPTQINAATTAIYQPIEVFVDGVKAIDKTSYTPKDQELLSPYQISNEYSYYMDNGAVYMNMNFDDTYKRKVSARIRYLTAYIKLKVVLRTNTTGDSDSYSTPLVNSYTLKFLSS